MASYQQARFDINNDKKALQDAIGAADLRELINEIYPAADAFHGSKRCKAAWRDSNDRNISLGCKDGVWVYHDHRDATGGNAYTFLVSIAGYSEREAAEYLLARYGNTSYAILDAYTRPSSSAAASKPSKSSAKPAESLTEPQVAAEDAAKERKRLDGLKRWLASSKNTSQSKYLDKKGLTGFTCEHMRFDKQRQKLGIRLYKAVGTGGLDDASLEPVTIQWINNNEIRFTAGNEQVLIEPLQKRFNAAPAGTTQGAFTILGCSSLQSLKGLTYLAEGFATAASIHLLTGRPVVCTYSAANLGKVAKVLAKLGLNKRCNFLIAADDDAGNEQNTGLEKAHYTALQRGYRICSPAFDTAIIETIKASGGKLPSDFNDLMQLQGIEACKQQLEMSQAKYADAALAFADILRKAQAKRDATPAMSQGRYMPSITLKDGITILKAPHGTGKTHAMLPHIEQAKAAGSSVLYITHRRALADDAARRYGLVSYEEVSNTDIRHISNLAICINSLPRLLDGLGSAASFDTVIIDESEQLMQALTGSHIRRNRKSVLDMLEHLSQRARRLCLLDADAGQLTMLFCRAMRPLDKPRWLLHHHPVGNGRHVNVLDNAEDLLQRIVNCKQPMFITCNTKAGAEKIHTLLEAQGRQGWLITSDTAASMQQELADINSAVTLQQPEYLVSSPTINTGYNITNGYFKQIFGMFHSCIGTPQDALQSLWRVRTPASYDVWLDKRTRLEFIDIEAKYGDELAAAEDSLRLEAGFDASKLVRHGFYETLKYHAERQYRFSAANYRFNFLKLITLQGFTSCIIEPSGGNGLLKLAKVLADEAYIEAALEDKYKLQSLKAFYRLTGYPAEDDAADDAIDEATLRYYLQLDDKGRYRGKLQALELALADEEYLKQALQEAAAGRDTLHADIPRLASRRAFNKRLLEAVGFADAAVAMLKPAAAEDAILAADVAMPRYTKESLQSLLGYIEQERHHLQGLMQLPSSKQLAANPIRYVGSWLESLGLQQRRQGKNDKGLYGLKQQPLQQAIEAILQRGHFPLYKYLFIVETVPSLEPTLEPANPAAEPALDASLLPTLQDDDDAALEPTLEPSLEPSPAAGLSDEVAMPSLQGDEVAMLEPSLEPSSEPSSAMSSSSDDDAAIDEVVSSSGGLDDAAVLEAAATGDHAALDDDDDDAEESYSITVAMPAADIALAERYKKAFLYEQFTFVSKETRPVLKEYIDAALQGSIEHLQVLAAYAFEPAYARALELKTGM